MSLPPALAFKLARRGLVELIDPQKKNNEQIETEEHSSPSKLKKSDAKQGHEEVIAEDYGEQYDSQESSYNRDESEEESSDYSSSEGSYKSYKKFKGHIGCPNKVNIYHNCTTFCEERWREGKRIPDYTYLRKKFAMLEKYPLPNHWKEIYDPGVGVHYYWEVDSDAVSWLPPSHPRAVITQPAAVERFQRYKNQTTRESTNSETSEYTSSESEDSSSDEENELEKQRMAKKLRLEAIEKAHAKGRNKLKMNNLDPMDPASYSDIPRGGWSDGLFKGNEAKTGVDVTVAGPLYQMRPYPSPGAVLRANSEQKSTKPKK